MFKYSGCIYSVIFYKQGSKNGNSDEFGLSNFIMESNEDNQCPPPRSQNIRGQGNYLI